MSSFSPILSHDVTNILGAQMEAAFPRLIYLFDAPPSFPRSSVLPTDGPWALLEALRPHQGLSSEDTPTQRLHAGGSL